MGAFTSRQTGNWNDQASWNDGVSGYPNTAADTVTIGTGHTITVNGSFPASGGFGTGSITGKLLFNTSGNSQISIATGVNWTFNSGGELEMKPTSGYTAKILHANAGDGTFGFVFSLGSIIDIAGADAYYGSTGTDYADRLGSNWVSVPASGASSFVTATDMSSVWKANNELIVFKNAASYTGATTDWVRVNLDSFSSTTINCTMIDGVASTPTFLANGTILNLSRNVVIGKESATRTCGNYNASAGPKLTISSNYADVNVIGAEIIGIRGSNIDANGTWSKCVFRNSNSILPNGGGYHFNGDNLILFSNNINLTQTSGKLSNSYMVCNSNGAYNMMGTDLDSCYIFGNTNGIYGPTNCIVIDSYVYCNTTDLTYSNMLYFYNGGLGVSQHGTVCTNAIITFPCHGGAIVNTNVPAIPPVSSRNTCRSLIGFDHLDQTAGDFRTRQSHGDMDNTTLTGETTPPLRDGGNSEVILCTPYSTCTQGRLFYGWKSAKYLTAGTYNIKVYCYNDFASDITGSTIDNKINLFALYNDTEASGHIAKLVSDETLTKDTWDYLEVDLVQAYDGFVRFWIEINAYASGKYIWIDPMMVIT